MMKVWLTYLILKIEYIILSSRMCTFSFLITSINVRFNLHYNYLIGLASLSKCILWKHMVGLMLLKSTNDNLMFILCLFKTFINACSCLRSISKEITVGYCPSIFLGTITSILSIKAWDYTNFHSLNFLIA